MTDSTIVTIVTAIPTTLAAVAGLLVALANAKRAEVIIEKATEIHTLTNSTLSKLQASLEVAHEKIAGLEKLNASLSSQK